MPGHRPNCFNALEAQKYIRKIMLKRILITGASGGIGAAIVEKLSTPTCQLAIHYNSNKEGAERVAEAIKSIVPRVELIQADLSVESGRRSLIEEVTSLMGGCDLLINNAGGPHITKRLGEYNEEDAAQIIGLNFLSAFFLCQTFFPPMCRNNYGRIVNISSIGVKFGGDQQTLLYSASKAALEALSLNLAKAGAEHNVLQCLF